jgi:hypothetical protein
MTVPKRFNVLRFLAGLVKALAWIELFLAVLSAVGFAILGSQLGSLLGPELGDYGALLSGGTSFITGLIVIFLGLFYFVLLYGLGELLSVTLAMEENTRLTAALLLKMHQDTQAPPVDTRPAYPGGFASEPEPYR